MAFRHKRIEIVCADITTLKVGAIVNAANESLLGGGGVDGAIHKAAGPKLLEVCKELGGCPTGQAKSTLGFNLPAEYVIHTVGPVWKGGQNNEDAMLASCYLESLKRARELELESLAFPAISTGIYGFPVERATVTALHVTHDFLKDNHKLRKVIFCCFSKADQATYEAIGSSIL
jgi:O-acetyl-ADP-ribose deacetylase (regulator of RNase III)